VVVENILITAAWFARSYRPASMAVSYGWKPSVLTSNRPGAVAYRILEMKSSVLTRSLFPRCHANTSFEVRSSPMNVYASPMYCWDSPVTDAGVPEEKVSALDKLYLTLTKALDRLADHVGFRVAA
jgi:hypothetical protein